MQLLRCHMGGKAVLVEDSTIVQDLALERVPEPLVAEEVYHFSHDLLRLSQGVTGVAVVDNACLPIVSPEYFRPDRTAASPVRTVDRSGPLPVASPGARRFFVFGAPGALGFQFALSMNQVLEVSRGLPMAPLGFAYSHYAGVAVWRGETIPVVDLAFAAKLGAIRGDAAVERMLIVRNQMNRIFAIAATGQVRQPVASSHVYAPDSVSVRPMRGIRGVFRYEGSPLLVPDLDALVD